MYLGLKRSESTAGFLFRILPEMALILFTLFHVTNEKLMGLYDHDEIWFENIHAANHRFVRFLSHSLA